MATSANHVKRYSRALSDAFAPASVQGDLSPSLGAAAAGPLAPAAGVPPAGSQMGWPGAPPPQGAPATAFQQRVEAAAGANAGASDPLSAVAPPGDPLAPPSSRAAPAATTAPGGWGEPPSYASVAPAVREQPPSASGYGWPDASSSVYKTGARIGTADAHVPAAMTQSAAALGARDLGFAAGAVVPPPMAATVAGAFEPIDPLPSAAPGPVPVDPVGGNGHVSSGGFAAGGSRVLPPPGAGATGGGAAGWPAKLDSVTTSPPPGAQPATPAGGGIHDDDDLTGVL